MTRAPLVSRSLRQRAWLGSRVLQPSGLLGRAASFRGRMRVTEMLDRIMASACPAVWPGRDSRALAGAVMLRDHGFAAVSSPPSPLWGGAGGGGLGISTLRCFSVLESRSLTVRLRNRGASRTQADSQPPTPYPSPRWGRGAELPCHQNNRSLLLTVGGAA